ncbi:MAG: hypothetical protein JNM27_18595 [Leptospirales bacterium]|nr:hypothetical protein [Leptospirales bacterium]
MKFKHLANIRQRSNGEHVLVAYPAPKFLRETPKAEVGETVPRSEASTTFQRVKGFLTEHYHVRFNTVRCCPEIASKADGEFFEITDRKLANIICHLDERRISCTPGQLKTLLQSSFVNDFNPIREYFENLKWNQRPSIEPLFKLLDVDEKRIVLFRRWMIAAVACGCYSIPNHIFLILLGLQGAGKTTFLNKLCPIEGYGYCGPLNPGDRESRLRLGRYFLVNLDEFSATNDRDLQRIKSLVTVSQVNERRPYGRREESIPRHASLCGSLNEIHFLKDDTGNRRFAVLEVGSISFQQVTQELVDQAWAEAYTLYKHGEQTHPTSQELSLIEQINQSYRSRSLEEQLVCESFRAGSKEDHNFQGTSTEILRFFAETRPECAGSLKVERIGRALKSIGATQSSVRDGASGSPRYIYHLNRISPSLAASENSGDQ